MLDGLPLRAYLGALDLLHESSIPMLMRAKNKIMPNANRL
jgi:hypothetical protein